MQLTSLTHDLIAKSQYNFPFVQQQVTHKTRKLIENNGLCLRDYAEEDCHFIPERRGKRQKRACHQMVYRISFSASWVIPCYIFSLIFFFFFFFFVSSNQSDVLSRMRGHHNVGLGANGIFTTPQAGHGLLLGVELQAGLAVKGVGTATGNTLLVAGEGEHG